MADTARRQHTDDEIREVLDRCRGYLDDLRLSAVYLRKQTKPEGFDEMVAGDRPMTRRAALLAVAESLDGGSLDPYGDAIRELDEALARADQAGQAVGRG